MSAKSSQLESEKSSCFLNRKRNLSFIQSNYLIRRILSPISNEANDYEKNSNLYYLLMSFNWNDETTKNSVYQNLRGNSLWFYFCSTYFPYVSNELIDNYQIIPDAIRRFVLDRQLQSKNIYKKNSPLPKRTKFNKSLMSLMDLYDSDKKTQLHSIEDMINNIQGSIDQIEKINNEKILANIKKDFILTKEYDSNRVFDEYLRMDMEYHSKYLKKFVEYIKMKNESRSISNDDYDPDDVVCVVCNDGDYEDDNLIVYCAVCHITVHQKCYGIPVVPKDDWICQSCILSNNDVNVCNNIECILCPCKGGAMKPCSLKKTSMLYIYLMSLRNAEENKSHNTNTNTIFITTNPSSNCNSNFTNSTNAADESSSTWSHIPSSPNDHAWVHLSCALWVPEIIIGNYEYKDKIKGLEAICKKRFMEKCEICLKRGYGPTIKCERCDLRFHAECARINKFQLEITENQQGENKFHIFCQRHAPHKLVKARELKKQREIDDIKQFAHIIERNIDTYNRHHKSSMLSVYNRAKGEKSVDLSSKLKKIKLNSKEKKSFINAIRSLAIEISSLNCEISRDYSYISPSINLSYTDMLMPSKFPYYMLKETETYLQGIKPIEVFHLFKMIVPTEEEYNKLILRKVVKPQPKETPNKVINYCYCHKNDEAFMIGCEMGEKCVNNGWYHLYCLEELKNLSQEDVSRDNFKYYCPECRKKYKITEIPPLLCKDDHGFIGSTSASPITKINEEGVMK